MSGMNTHREANTSLDIEWTHSRPKNAQFEHPGFNDQNGGTWLEQISGYVFMLTLEKSRPLLQELQEVSDFSTFVRRRKGIRNYFINWNGNIWSQYYKRWIWTSWIDSMDTSIQGALANYVYQRSKIILQLFLQKSVFQNGIKNIKTFLNWGRNKTGFYLVYFWNHTKEGRASMRMTNNLRHLFPILNWRRVKGLPEIFLSLSIRIFLLNWIFKPDQVSTSRPSFGMTELTQHPEILILFNQNHSSFVEWSNGNAPKQIRFYQPMLIDFSGNHLDAFFNTEVHHGWFSHLLLWIQFLVFSIFFASAFTAFSLGLIFNFLAWWIWWPMIDSDFKEISTEQDPKLVLFSKQPSDHQSRDWIHHYHG